MKKFKNNNQDFLTVRELADILGISRVAVFKKIKKGQIDAKKIGRNFVIPKSGLQGVIYNDLTDKLKKEIDKGVTKVLNEYSEVLKLLGKE